MLTNAIEKSRSDIARERMTGRVGSDHPSFKHGKSATKEYHREYLKEWRKRNRAHHNTKQIEYRHSKGINKTYWSDFITGLSRHEYKRHSSKVHRAISRAHGKLTVRDVQSLYESNINNFGTLTCYLCFSPIAFGDDAIDHKTPVSRGGTNDLCNIGIAHKSCNCKKSARTEEEYRNILAGGQ